MNSITVVKQVKESGSSLAIYLTKELRMLELEKDDNVEITLKKIF